MTSDSNIITIIVAPGFVRLFCTPKKVHEVIFALGAGKIATADSSKTLAVDDALVAGDYVFVPDDAGRIAEARRKMRAFSKGQWIHADVEFGMEVLPVDLSLRFGELCDAIRGEFGIPADHRLITDAKRHSPEMTLAECGVGPCGKICIADADEPTTTAAIVAPKEDRVRVRFRGPGIKKSKISATPSTTIRVLLDQLRECKVLPAGIKHRASVRGHELSMDDQVSEVKSSMMIISPD